MGKRAALITGGGSGIGRATALSLSEAEFGLLFLVGRTLASLERTAELIRARSPETEVVCVAADLSRPGTPQEILERVAQHTDGLDALVNNAAEFHKGTFEQCNRELCLHALETNLIAPAELVRHFAPLLARRRGSVVNVSSTLAEKPICGALVYSVSKAGLNHLSRTLALELAGVGVRVNAVMPGIVPTGMYRSRFETEEELTRALKAAVELHPLGRVGEPEEVADVIAFLASERSRWVTGVALGVDGGLLAT